MPSISPHAVRIVPTHAAMEAPARKRQMPAPLLTYRNGPLITAAEVFTIFWGSAWGAEQAPLVEQINGFFQYIVTSPLIDQLAEYSRPGLQIGHGTFAGSQSVDSPDPGPSVSDARVQDFLASQAIATRAFGNAQGPTPNPNSNRLVFIYLPPGTVVTMGGAASCTGFCGYHNDIDGERFYAVMPFPGCAGCTGSLTAFDALTSTSSHELCEAITDPVAGTGWYNDQQGEIGDICAWQTKSLGRYTVQKLWSNANKTCI